MGEGFADTSLLVRYLTGDPPEMAQRAARIVDEVGALRITSVVLAETAYVLQSVYKVPRADIVHALQDLVMRRNVVASLAKEHVVRALDLCRPSARVSFADALIWAEALAEPCRRVYTFDQRFPNQEIEVVRP
jgi:predicted nucleic-acid-binding protein